MKTRFLYAFAASVALLLTGCSKTYNCTCDAGSGIVNGQVKAVSKAKALKRCKSNCSQSNGTVVVN